MTHAYHLIALAREEQHWPQGTGQESIALLLPGVYCHTLQLFHVSSSWGKPRKSQGSSGKPAATA